MMTWLAGALREHPELALFLVIALGHAIGRLRFGPVRLNVVIGVLIAGVVVGQADIVVPAAMQWAFFCLFLFSIGYRTGPQFFRGLGRGALPQIALTLVLCGSGLAVTIAIARLLGFDAGAAAGLLAGGLNASAAIGTAAGAIAGLPVGETARQALATNVTVAFAVTYLVGLVATILTLAKIGPWILRVDLAAECRKLESAIGADAPEPGVVSAYREHAARAYTLPAALDGRRAADLEAGFAPARVFVERLRAAGGIVDADPETTLRAGDIVVLSGPRQALADAKQPLSGHEVDDAELLDVPVVEADVVMSHGDLAGRTLAAIREIVEREVPARGVFVRRILRAGQEIPRGRDVVVERGDVVTLVGTRRHIDRIAARVGSLRRRTVATDLLMVGAAIAVGGIVGLPALRVAGLDLGLSLPVGVLAGGLVAGWLRSVRPVFGQVPEPALWLFDSLGLTAFLALVGIGAGPGFVEGVRTSGLALVLAGVLVGSVPHLVTILVGRHLLRQHPGVLLGICAGAGTSPAGLAAVQDAARSRVPTLGYGVSYALGNVLLALWGSVVVILMAR